MCAAKRRRERRRRVIRFAAEERDAIERLSRGGLPGAACQVAIKVRSFVYDGEHAWQVIDAAVADYKESYELGAPSLRF